MELPRVAVFYAGGFQLGTVIAAAESLCRLEFWIEDEYELSRETARLLRARGTVVRYPRADVGSVARASDPAPDGVMTGADHLLEPAAAAAAVWGLPFHSPEVAHTLARKSLQRAALDASARPVQWTTWPTNISSLEVGGVDGPVVVKPDRGAGSLNMFRAASEHEARERLDRTADPASTYVIENDIPAHPPLPGLGDYLSAEMLRGSDGWWSVAINGRFPALPTLGETGNMLPLALPGDLEEQAVATAREALDLMGVDHGICHVEMKLRADGPVIVEVNGRLGGGVGQMVRTAADWDLVREVLLMALGRTAPRHEVPWTCMAGKLQLFVPPGATAVPPWPDVTALSADPGVTFLTRLRDEGEPLNPLGGTGEAFALVGITGPDLPAMFDVRRRVHEHFGLPLD